MSFYNESATGRSIEPSPIVAALGVFEDYSVAVSTALRAHPGVIVLTGPRGSKTGRRLRWHLTGETGGTAGLDFDLERQQLNAVREAVAADSSAPATTSPREVSRSPRSDGARRLPSRRIRASNPDLAPSGAAPEVRLLRCARLLMETFNGRLRDLLALFERHGVDAVMTGRTIPEPKLRFLDAGTTLIGRTSPPLAGVQRALRPYVG